MIKEAIPKSRKPSKVSGTEVVKISKKVDVVWSLKEVDREKWVAISKVALPLRVCTAMAADMTGECLLIGVLNLILNRNLNVGNINRCIDGLIGMR